MIVPFALFRLQKRPTYRKNQKLFSTKSCFRCLRARTCQRVYKKVWRRKPRAFFETTTAKQPNRCSIPRALEASHQRFCKHNVLARLTKLGKRKKF